MNHDDFHCKYDSINLRYTALDTTGDISVCFLTSTSILMIYLPLFRTTRQVYWRYLECMKTVRKNSSSVVMVMCTVSSRYQAIVFPTMQGL